MVRTFGPRLEGDTSLWSSSPWPGSWYSASSVTELASDSDLEEMNSTAEGLSLGLEMGTTVDESFVVLVMILSTAGVLTWHMLAIGPTMSAQDL